MLYYATTRRVKLEKVGKYLQKKNESDVYRNRTGNIQVTLEIVASLIKKCPDDLNVFAGNVNAILLSVFRTKDLSLAQHAEPVFKTFCETLGGELFNGDADFVNQFTLLSETFLSLGVNVSQANTNEWRAISLKAASSIASCDCLTLGRSSHIVNKAIPLVVSEISEVTEDNLIKRTLSHGSEQGSLSRFNTARSTVLKVEKEPASPMEIDLEELAISALKSFFKTSSTTKLSASTRAVSDYLVKSQQELNWSARLVEMITLWVPVQLRFVILAILTSKLDKNGSVREHLIYLHAITSLLSSSVNLVGLPVIDNLRLFVHQQKFALLNSQNQELVDSYTAAIGSLSTHIYYQDQTLDSVAELLSKIRETANVDLLLTYLEDTTRVIYYANQKKTFQRAFVPLEVFEDTFFLLSHENTHVQAKYIDLLISELSLEYKENAEYLKPDYEGLIAKGKESVINLFYEQLEHIKSIQYNKGLLKLIELLITTFGINAAVNFIPFFYQWKLSKEEDVSESEVLRDNIAYATTYFASSYGKYTKLVDEVLARIRYRIEHGKWVFEGFPEEKISQTPRFLLHKEEFDSLVKEYSLNEYEEVISVTHYRYNPRLGDSHEIEHVDPDQSYLSANQSQNLSLAMLVQPSAINSCENNSIKSAPLSARSLLVGKLNIPKVQELRKAISGHSLLPPKSNTTSQRTDIGSILNDLALDDLDTKGNLVA